jgi:hypothetical protein
MVSTGFRHTGFIIMKINAVNKIYRAIGLMSGTSLDGVDVALIETDGQGYVAAEGFHYMPYDEELRARIRACFGARERAGDIDAGGARPDHRPCRCGERIPPPRRFGQNRH